MQAKYTKINIDELTSPKKTGMYKIYINYWFLILDGKIIEFQVSNSLLCNESKEIVEKLLHVFVTDEIKEIRQFSLIYYPIKESYNTIIG